MIGLTRETFKVIFIFFELLPFVNLAIENLCRKSLLTTQTSPNYKSNSVDHDQLA